MSIKIGMWSITFFFPHKNPRRNLYRTIIILRFSKYPCAEIRREDPQTSLVYAIFKANLCGSIHSKNFLMIASLRVAKTFFFWMSIAKKINRRNHSNLSGTRCKEKFLNLTRAYYVSKHNAMCS